MASIAGDVRPSALIERDVAARSRPNGKPNCVGGEWIQRQMGPVCENSYDTVRAGRESLDRKLCLPTAKMDDAC